MLLANISILLLEITNAERDKARKKYESQREMVKETVAFGRHVDGPPKKVYTPPPSGTFESFGFDSGRPPPERGPQCILRLKRYNLNLNPFFSQVIGFRIQ